MSPSTRLVPRVADKRSWTELLSEYRKVGAAITVNFRQLVHWPSYPERATHIIHPYPAKLLAHIPFFFLSNEQLSKPGTLVLDPFCGSGTVLLEAVLSGRRAIGADPNPLARLIANVKCHRYSVGLLSETAEQLLAAIPAAPYGDLPPVHNLEHWFYPHVAEQLLRIRNALDLLPEGPTLQFFQVCFSNTVRRVSLADPRLSVPVRLRPEQYEQGHWLRNEARTRLNRLRRINVIQEFARCIDANLARSEALYQTTKKTEFQILSDDARDLKAARGGIIPRGRRVRAGSVQMVITSPPYAGAQKYIRSSSLSIGWLGLAHGSTFAALESSTIGREHHPSKSYERLQELGYEDIDLELRRIYKVNPLRAQIVRSYLIEMRAAIKETARVIADGGHMVLITGNNRVCGQEFPTSKFLKEIAESEGLRVILELSDKIRSRGLMTKRNATAGMIDSESVFVLRK